MMFGGSTLSPHIYRYHIYGAHILTNDTRLQKPDESLKRYIINVHLVAWCNLDKILICSCQKVYHVVDMYPIFNYFFLSGFGLFFP